MHVNKKIIAGLFLLGFLGFFAPQVFALTAGEVQKMVDAGIIATAKIPAAQRMIDETDTRPAPTVSILIDGKEEHTVYTGDTLPVVSWSSSATSTRNVHSVQLIPSNRAKCGNTTMNQVWQQGKNREGSFQLAGKALDAWRECDMTYKFIVKDVLGTEYTDTAVLKYRARTTANTNTPAPTILIGGTAAATVAVGQIPPVITWSNTGTSNRVTGSYTVNHPNYCGFGSATVPTVWKKGDAAIITVANSKNGTHTFSAPATAARKDCVVTYKYEASNTTTGEGPFAATATLTYTAAAIAPTAVITANNQKDITVKAGETVPTISWKAENAPANASTIKTELFVNDSRLCKTSGGNPITNGQVWSQGKTASSTTAVSSPVPTTANSVGCELTFRYTATNTVAGTSATDSAIIRYVAAESIPTAELKIGGLTDYTVKVNERLPVFTWNGADGAVATSSLQISTSYKTDDWRVCGDLPRSAQTTPVNVTSFGTTKYGQWQVPETWKAPANRDQCVVTYTYKVRNKVTGKETSASAKLRYAAATTTVTAATNTTTPPQAGTEILLLGISRSATLQQAQYTTDAEKGIYTIELQIMAVKGDIYIPEVASLDDLASAGFDLNVTKGTDNSFTGNKFASVSEAKLVSPNQSLALVGGRYKIPSGKSGIFTVRVELDPTDEASNQMFGIELKKVKFAGTSGGALSTEIVPDQPIYETDKITIAQNTTDNLITPTIAKGAEGKKVSLIQQALKNAGYFTEEVTGYFGNVTKNAVAAFQQANALENIGAVGPKTAQLLNQFLTF